MRLNHIGIISKTEDQAVRFYQNFLGMNKTREYVVPPELAHQVFSVSLEMKVVTFSKDDVNIELFICPECDLPSPNISHFCLHLENFSEVLKTAHQAGVDIISGRKGDKHVYFIRDFSGNMIEIKPVQQGSS